MTMTAITTAPHLCSQRNDSDSGHYHQHCAASTTMATVTSQHNDDDNCIILPIR